MSLSKYLDIPFTPIQLDRLPSEAWHNVVICMALEDGDLLVTSLADMIDEEEAFHSLHPSEALRAFIGDTDPNSWQILIVYGSGGWVPSTIDFNER